MSRELYLQSLIEHENLALTSKSRKPITELSKESKLIMATTLFIYK